MLKLRTIKLDDFNEADEVKPGLWAVRQKSRLRPTGPAKTIYLTTASIKQLAAQL